MADLFDQYEAQTQARQPAAQDAPAAPAGDLFDQYEAQGAAPAAIAPTAPAVDQHAAGEYIRGRITAGDKYDPDTIAATYEAFRHQAEGRTKLALPQTIAPDTMAERFGKGVSRTFAHGTTGAVGLADPELAGYLRQQQGDIYGHGGVTDDTAGGVGEFTGGLAQAPIALTPIGRALSAAEAAGNKRIDIAERRARGEDVSGLDEFANAAGSAGVDWAVNKGSASLLKGLMPSTVFAKPAANIAARLGGEALGNAGIAEGSQFTNNVVNRVTSGDQTSLMQGVDLNTGLTGAGQGLVMAGLHMATPRPAGMRSLAETPVADQAHVQGVTDRLANHLEAPPEAPDPAAAAKAATEKAQDKAFDDVSKQATFEGPEKISQSPEDTRIADETFKRMNEADLTDRRQENVPVPEERRFDEVAKGHTFESPEQAGANPFFANLRGKALPEVPSGLKPEAAKAETAQPDRSSETDTGGAKGLLSRLHADEGGSLTVPKSKTLADVGKGLKDTLAGIDKQFHMGITATPKGERQALSLREQSGKAELAGHEFEAKLTPFRDVAPSLSKDKAFASQIADSMEAGNTGGVKELQPALDFIQTKRTENAARAKALGIDHLDEQGQGLSRMFEFPKREGQGDGGEGSIAGVNHPFYKQKFNTFSEALAAAEAAGGKPKYDNVLDMQIARQYQVEKNLAAREGLRSEEVNGNAEWVKDGDRPTGERTDGLKDRIIGEETRRMAMPKYLVAQAAGMEHFDALKFLEDHANQEVPVRPGEQPPDGMAFNGRSSKGQFHMDPESAAKYNNLLSEPKTDAAMGVVRKALSTLVKYHYDMNLTHGLNATLAGGIGQIRAVIGRALHGEFGAAGQSALDAMTGGYLKGRKLRADIEAGKSGEVGSRVMASGPKLALKSVTDVGRFKEMKDAFTEGNILTGSRKAVDAVVGIMHDATFKNILPNILAGHAATVAENQIRRGVTGERAKVDMANEVDVMGQIIGSHLRDPNFRQDMARDIASLILPASRFWQGRIQVMGKALKGNPAALSMFATGTALTVAVGAAVQMALTAANTGKAQLPTSLFDAMTPRTGRKDENGHDERIALPGPIAWAYRLLKDPAKDLKASVHPAISGAIETVNNKDWQGNQVRPDDATQLQNTARGAWHIAKGALPMATPDPYAPPGGQELRVGDHVGSFFGIRRSHPVTSEAEQEAYDTLGKRGGEGRNLAAQQQHADEKKWVGMIRGGQQKEAIGEMVNSPEMSEARGTSLFRRAASKQGLAGLVTDTAFGPKQLLTIWNKATPEEKADMQQSVTYRMEGAKPGSRAETEEWKALLAAVHGGKK